MYPWSPSLKQITYFAQPVAPAYAAKSFRAATFTVHPGMQQASSCLCRMGTAAKQLEQLNEEIAALNLEVKAAFKAYESAATTTARTAIDLVGAPEDKRFQMIHDGAQKGEHRALGNYEDLKKDKERLLEDRRALHAKLPSAGERIPLLPCQQYQALLVCALVHC